MMSFDSYLAIDWSGSRSPTHGIQIAECRSGSGPPRLIAPPARSKWRRSEVRDWIAARVAGKETLLIGFDFAFAYPFCDHGAYFPGNPVSPQSVQDLWRLVESICSAAPDLYGGPFYLNRDAPFAEYLCYQSYTGNRFDASRMRITEALCKTLGARPSCVLKCVGPGSVGSGSVAGMRLLHYFSETQISKVCIWPFEPHVNQSVMVEMFPTYFYALAACDPTKWQDRTNINKILQVYNSGELNPDETIRTKDQSDALISAAALRFFSMIPDAWSPAQLSPSIKAFEGWIFGLFRS